MTTLPPTVLPPWLTPVSGGVHIRIRVVPRAQRTMVQGMHGDALKVRIQAPPVDDKANLALIEFLAGALELPRHNIALASGARGRCKTIMVRGLAPGSIADRLAP